MQRLCHLALAAFLLLSSAGLAGAQDTERNPTLPSGGLVTLYQLDPVAQSFDFTDYHAGDILKDHRVLANGAEIDFGTYHADSLTVADSNGSTGRIIDLGTSKTLQAKYDNRETVGDGQGFASIHRKGTAFLIGQRRDKEDGSKYQELSEGAQLLTDLHPLDFAAVTLGHIYLLHVVRSLPSPADTFVKFLVVAYQPGQSVTFRWEMMPEE